MIPELDEFARDVRAQGFSHAVLLGMGGSSLCADVLRSTFPPAPSHPPLLVLDSTDPGRVLEVSETAGAERTLYVIASKSGTTLEPDVLAAYFLERMKRRSRFVVVTDPGSRLEQLARERGAWRVFRGVPGIGGRFSALSVFGLVPAAVLGADPATILGRARVMVDDCGANVPAAFNPGVRLGVLLGEAARRGVDKLTVVCSPAIEALGTWIEQLVAESTGKSGRAIVPVEREPRTSPAHYGADRLFVYLRLESGPDPEQDAWVRELELARFPVATITVSNTFDLAKEFFRWEVATAVAGHFLGVNPFDQPDVEASKVATRELCASAAQKGALPPDEPLRCSDPEAMERLAGLLASVRAGDYFAILAWLPQRADLESALQRIRAQVLEGTRAATTLGFGPRYLHSTGQAHKGGRNNGVFLVLTSDDPRDAPIPGHALTFGQVKAAQARGDIKVLEERGRRVLRLHLGPDHAQELALLERMMCEAVRR